MEWTDDTMHQVKKIAAACSLVLLAGCSKPRAEVPPLTPEQASGLLQTDNKARNWMEYVKKNNTGCEYKLDLPDQSNQPVEIDLNHIVSCSGRPSPKEFDATVVFVYDPAQQHWIIQRFSS
jgi:hypothetical protein